MASPEHADGEPGLPQPDSGATAYGSWVLWSTVLIAELDIMHACIFIQATQWG